MPSPATPSKILESGNGRHLVAKIARPSVVFLDGDTEPYAQAGPSRVAVRFRGVQGILASAASAVLFAMVGAGVHLVADVFPATQTMLVRVIIQGSISMSCLKLNGLPLLGDREVWGWVVLRGLIGATGNLVFFFGLTQLPLGDATTVSCTNPIFTALYSCLCLREPFSANEALALVLSFTGVVLIARPSVLFGSEAAPYPPPGTPHQLAPSVPRHVAISIGLFGAMVVGAVVFIVKKIGKRAHYMSLVFSFSGAGIIMSSSSLAAGLQEANWPGIHEVGTHPYLVLVGIGILATSAQTLFNLGMQLEQIPAISSIMSMLTVPFACVLQVGLFGEPIALLSVVGTALVLASSMMILGRRLCSGPARVETAAANEASVSQDGCEGEGKSTGC